MCLIVRSEMFRLVSISKSFWNDERKVGTNIMMQVRAAHFQFFGFLSLRNAQTIEPTTAWAAVSFPGSSTRYSFLHFSGLGRALQPRHGANSGEIAAQWTFPQCKHQLLVFTLQRSGLRPMSEQCWGLGRLISSPTGKIIWLGRGSNPGHLGPDWNLPLRHTGTAQMLNKKY